MAEKELILIVILLLITTTFQVTGSKKFEKGLLLGVLLGSRPLLGGTLLGGNVHGYASQSCMIGDGYYPGKAK